MSWFPSFPSPDITSIRKTCQFPSNTYLISAHFSLSLLLPLWFHLSAAPPGPLQSLEQQLGWTLTRDPLVDACAHSLPGSLGPISSDPTFLRASRLPPHSSPCRGHRDPLFACPKRAMLALTLSLLLMCAVSSAYPFLSQASSSLQLCKACPPFPP